MSSYAALDAAIVDYIISSPGKSPTTADRLRNLACDEYGADGDFGMRLIDRRLQAMRKAGRIRYKKATLDGVGGWRLTEGTEA